MNNILNKLKKRQAQLSVIGLGYVGLPIAISFSRKFDVIGFDVNEEKIRLYKSGVDPTQEVGEEIKSTSMLFTNDPADLRKASFHIVAVPTPVDKNKTPDLSLVESACELLGNNLSPGSIIVFESTVYPGVTEDVCVPIVEKYSNMKCGKDFFVGYSPERINPGDKEHRLENIVKIVSGMNAEVLQVVSTVYEEIITAGVYQAESIKVAEAAKVIENAQRDINIAFMNELSIIFNKLGINTKAVLNAAGTKWNFLKFTPGLVGGHCIGVDPYYLTFKAEQVGYHSQIILSGRQINDNMGAYIADNLIKALIKANKKISNANIYIFGLTFKENCPDVRNTKVVDIVNELKEYGINCKIVDPIADSIDSERTYGLELTDISNVVNADAIIFAVAHDSFKGLSTTQLFSMFSKEKDERPVIIDVKSIFDPQNISDEYIYWSL